MEHLICIQCGAEVRPEEAYHVAEEAVCPSCAEADTVVCSYCGERIWRENDFGDSDTALCEACYTNHYTRCNQCGRLISFSAAYYQDEDEDEETPYCSACYHECGEAIHCYHAWHRSSALSRAGTVLKRTPTVHQRPCFCGMRGVSHVRIVWIQRPEAYAHAEADTQADNRSRHGKRAARYGRLRYRIHTGAVLTHLQAP